MSEEKNSLADRVANWMETQGYPLEMRAARELRSHGLAVDIGRYYTDPESRQQREIDIVASVASDFGDKKGTVEVALSIECKSAKDKPWVLIADRESANRRHHTWWWHRIDEPRHWLSDAQRHALEESKASYPLLTPDPKTTGYGLVRAFAGGNEDVAFTAMAAASKATASILENTCSSNDFIGANYYFTLAVPLVLVDAPLMMCDLDDTGRPRLVAVDRGTVAWRYRIVPNYPEITVVTVATLAALPSLADDLRKTADGLASLLNRFPPKFKPETEGDGLPF